MWLVIGYGSTLHSDDGFGPVVAEQLRVLLAPGAGVRADADAAPAHCIPSAPSSVLPSVSDTTGVGETPALPVVRFTEDYGRIAAHDATIVSHDAAGTISTPATVGAAMDKIGGGATMRAAANETIGNENHALRDPQPDLSGVHPSIRIHPEAGSTPVEVITIVQLTPELAEPVSQAGGVIFIDASVDGVPGEVVCCRLSAAHLRLSGPVPATTHHLTPATLLQTALLLYGQAPPAWIYTTGGATFELGETLSPAVAQAVPRTIDRILARLRDPDTPL